MGRVAGRAGQARFRLLSKADFLQMHASHMATRPTPPPIAVPAQRAQRRSDAAWVCFYGAAVGRTVLQAHHVLRQVLVAVEHSRELHRTLVVAVLDDLASCLLRLGGFGHGGCLAGATACVVRTTSHAARLRARHTHSLELLRIAARAEHGTSAGDEDHAQLRALLDAREGKNQACGDMLIDRVLVSRAIQRDHANVLVGRIPHRVRHVVCERVEVWCVEIDGHLV